MPDERPNRALQALIAVAVAATVWSGINPADRATWFFELFLGAGVLMAQSETPPADLVDVFLEYRGTTAAGLSAMIEADIASPIFRGLSAARRRAEEGLL